MSAAIGETLQRPRREAWSAVVKALTDLAEGHAQLVSHSERAWASITFSGTRHCVRLRFEGIDAAIVGEAMIEALPDNEFAIAGKLVADCSIEWAERTVNPLTLEFQTTLLLLDDN